MEDADKTDPIVTVPWDVYEGIEDTIRRQVDAEGMRCLTYTDVKLALAGTQNIVLWADPRGQTTIIITPQREAPDDTRAADPATRVADETTTDGPNGFAGIVDTDALEAGGVVSDQHICWRDDPEGGPCLVDGRTRSDPDPTHPADGR